MFQKLQMLQSTGQMSTCKENKRTLSPCGRGIKGEGEIHMEFPDIKK